MSSTSRSVSASDLQRPVWPLWAIGAAYFAAHEIGFLFPDSVKLLAAVWPAGGIGLSALLLNPRRRWPAIVWVILGSGIAADLVDGRTLAASLGFMTANAVESVACAWLICRWCGPQITFHRAREMTALFMAATAVNSGTALIGAFTAHATAGAEFWGVYKTWWIADGLGISLVTPLIVVWVRPDRIFRERHSRWALEFAAALVVTLLFAWTYFGPQRWKLPFFPHSYMLMMPLAWAALRLGPRGVTTIVGALAVSVLAATIWGYGTFPLEGSGPVEHLQWVQLFLGVDCGVALLLAAGIAQHQDSEASLRESELRYRELIEHATMAITVSVNETICYANPEAARILGAKGPSELHGRSTFDFVPEARWEELRQRRGRMRATGKVATVADVQIKRVDGSLIDIEARGLPIVYDGQAAIQTMFMDVSDRKRAHEVLRQRESQLRALTSRLQSLREEERAWVAREIHDHLGQLLTALSLDLRLVERRLLALSDPEVRTAVLTKVTSARGLADETIAAVQKIASELRPAALDRLGLEAAIESEAKAFAERTGLTMNLSLPAEANDVPPAQATAIFRIFQEVLTNVARHAQASSVTVQLKRTSADIGLTIEDDGVGIPEAELTNAASLGLLGMRERAQILGGSVAIGRKGDKGTAVAVVMPLNGQTGRAP